MAEKSNRYLINALVMGISLISLWGCAAPGPGRQAADSSPSSSTTPGGSSAAEAKALRAALESPGDTLLVDLLAGYRNLWSHAQGSIPLDAGIMQRAQIAAETLDRELRSKAGALPMSDSVASDKTLPGEPPATVKSKVDLTPSEASLALSRLYGPSAAADSLFLQGKYLEAWKVVHSAPDSVQDVDTKRERFGGRYCEEKRRVASHTFIEYRKVESLEKKKELLQSALHDLDSCLQYFPGLFVSERVVANRDMVKRELDKLNTR